MNDGLRALARQLAASPAERAREAEERQLLCLTSELVDLRERCDEQRAQLDELRYERDAAIREAETARATGEQALAEMRARYERAAADAEQRGRELDEALTEVARLSEMKRKQ